jgi:hypothetical protein
MFNWLLENRVINLVLLPFIVAGFYWLNWNFQYYDVQTTQFGLWMNQNISIPYLPLFGGILLLTNSLLINILYNKHNFLDKNTYIVAFLYCITMSFYHSFYRLDGALIAHTFIILTLYQLFELKQNEDGRKIVFNASFLLACAGTFFPPLVLSWPLLIVMILIVRPFVFREFILSIFGFLTPLIYAFIYFTYSQNKIDWKILGDVENDHLRINFVITTVVLFILYILGIIGLRTRLSKSSIRLKKQIQMLYGLIAMGLIVGFSDLFLFKQIERFSFMLIPLAFFFSFAFFNKRFSFASSMILFSVFIYSLLKFFLIAPVETT